MKFLAQLGEQQITARLIPVQSVERVIFTPAEPLTPARFELDESKPFEIAPVEKWELVGTKTGRVTAEWWRSMGFQMGDDWSKVTFEAELTWAIYRRAA